MTKKQLPLFFIALFAALFAAQSPASPFNRLFGVTNSSGKRVPIHGEGDEFDAVFETTNGYTVVTKDGGSLYFYALKGEGGALVPSGVEVGEETETIPSSLDKHLRDTSAAHAEGIRRRVAADEAANHTNENWENLKNKNRVEVEFEEESWFSRLGDGICSLFGGHPTGRATLTKPPTEPTAGQVVGLTIMVDFPSGSSSESRECHPDIDYGYICGMLNSENPIPSGNGMSVRTFYRGISRGKLDLTNSVIDYVMMSHPRSYYDDTTKDCGVCAKLLIQDVFKKLQARKDWKTKYVPMMQGISYTKKTKTFKSLSIMYAGSWPTKWCYGLWPHKSAISGLPTIKMKNGDQVRFQTYMITDISPYPSIGTFCHESGHMVCGFPDLYDYTGKTRGVGYFSMMAGNNDAAIDPYLAEAAGWITPVALPAQGFARFPYDQSTVYKYQNPRDKNQYYLIENRQKDGVDYDMPGKGMLIWRCNRKGSNTNGGGKDMGVGGNVWRKNFELSLVQADGEYHLERKGIRGHDEDYWKAENTSSNYVNEVNDATVPDLVWKDNKPSGLWISNISSNSGVMTAWVGEPLFKKAVKVKATGYSGKYDKKYHQISVVPYYPPSGVKVKYSKTKDGKYTTTNPKYKNAGEYTVWFSAEAAGYPSTNGCERVVIEK